MSEGRRGFETRTRADRERIAKLYASGLTVPQLRARFKIMPKTIRAILDEFEVPYRPVKRTGTYLQDPPP